MNIIIIGIIIFFSVRGKCVPNDFIDSSRHNNLLVKTTSGYVKGKTIKSFNGNSEFNAFQKIPYAKPPVGKLRFKPPEPADPWKGVYDATTEPVQCVQYNINNTIVGSEDCLYMRVYTPKRNTTDLLPVMYYIHGGGYDIGSPDFNAYGPDLLMEKGVILALVQYRLNVFGFLSTEDLTCPGNLGAKDQRFGLKWMFENAKAFGGDPNKITIFGHSAGGASVGVLLNTPTTAGYFRAAIQQSAAEIAYFARQLNAREKAFKIGKEFGYHENDSKTLIETLRTVDYKRLYSVANDVKIMGTYPRPIFATIMEPNHPDAIISQKPLQQIERGDYNRVPIMLGFTSLEGLTIFDYFASTVQNAQTNVTVLIPNSLFPKDKVTSDYVAKQIKYHYYDGNDFDYGSLRYGSDHIIVRALQKKARIVSKFNPTYLYKFSYIGLLGDLQHPIRRGVGHAEELFYLFHNSIEPKQVPTSDNRIRNQFVTLWTNFAKYLNPTPKADEALDNIIWSKFEEKTNYKGLLIDDKLTIRERINETDVLFWDRMFSYDVAHIGYY